MNKNIKSAILIGLGIIFIIGLTMYSKNKKYLEYSRLINPTYAEDQVDELHYAQSFLGHNLSDRDSMMKIYEKKMRWGDVALLGIVISILSAVVFVVFLIIFLVNKNKPQYATVQPSKNLSDQLSELGRLKEKGLLTEEEYISAKSKLLK